MSFTFIHRFNVRLCISAGLMIFYHSVFSQNAAEFVRPINVIPPSPTSYSLGKYGGMNTSLVTGTPSVSIPLGDLALKGIKIPVNLSYTSDGVRVDQVAGKAGMGWDLRAGGIINRIVYGVPDETGQALSVPFNLQTPSTELYTFYDAASRPGQFDLQPDIYSFSFGGYGGKFILSGGVVKQIVRSDLRIEANVEGYSFKITVPDGSIYYFGGTGAIETSNTESNCDSHSPGFTPTGWYLKKVVSYTGEVIDFNYVAYNTSYALGVNETIMRAQLAACEPCESTLPFSWDDNINQFCVSRLKTFSYLLSEISSNSYGHIKFSYISRVDLPGDYLLSKVRFFQRKDSTDLLKSIKLNYIFSNCNNSTTSGSLFSNENSFLYRAFLSNVQEYSATDQLVKQHCFNYDDINGLPPRLSFSQDFTGLYNGKNNNHIAAKITTNPMDAPPGFPLDLADRTPDWNFSRKGILNRIIYPTGGSDTIIYEPNTLYKEVITPAPIISKSVSGFGTGSRWAQIHTSAEFIPQLAQTAVIKINCEVTDYDPENSNSVYLFVKTEVVDQTTNEVVYLKGRTDAGQVVVEDVALEAMHRYIIRITSYGAQTFGNVVFDYKNQSSVSSMENVNEAGFRIRSLITRANGTGVDQVKRYYYGSPASNYLNSSGVTSYNPEYHTILRKGKICTNNIGSPDGHVGVYQMIVYGVYDIVYSNAINTQYLQNTPIQYQWVTESDGDNFENGATSHKFLLQYDTPGETLFGNGVFAAPLTNYGIMNGLETESNVFVKKNGDLVQIKKTETNYVEDPTFNFQSYGYVVRRNFPNLVLLNNPDGLQMEPFDAARYSIFRKWYYAESVKNTEYDTDGLNPVVRLTNYEYKGNGHTQLSKSTNSSSSGEFDAVLYHYPGDYLNIPNLSVAQTNALATLIAQNRISSPVQTTEITGSTEISKTRTDYRVWGNNLVLPEFLKVKNYINSMMEDRLVFHDYDGSGNLLAQSQPGQSKAVYLWSYHHQYPIAEIKNVDYAVVVAALGGAEAIEIFANKPMPTKLEIETFLAPVLNSAQLKAAHISRLTYSPLVGTLTATDAKGQTVYYEYDSFQRLKVIKDQNGDIIKSYDYHFKP